MYMLTFLTMALAATELSRAIPRPMQVEIIQDDGSDENKASINNALNRVNSMTKDTEKVFRKAFKAHLNGEGDFSKEMDLIRDVYGPDAGARMPEIMGTLNKFKEGTLVLHSSSGLATDAQRPDDVFRYAKTWTKPGSSNGPNTAPGQDIAYLSNEWHKDHPDNQALNMVHVASKTVAGTLEDTYIATDGNGRRMYDKSNPANVPADWIQHGGGSLSVPDRVGYRDLLRGPDAIPDEFVTRVNTIQDSHRNTDGLMAVMALSEGFMKTKELKQRRKRGGKKRQKKRGNKQGKTRLPLDELDKSNNGKEFVPRELQIRITRWRMHRIAN